VDLIDSQKKYTQINSDLKFQIQQLQEEVLHKDKIIDELGDTNANLIKKNDDLSQKLHELQIQLKKKLDVGESKVNPDLEKKQNMSLKKNTDLNNTNLKDNADLTRLNKLMDKSEIKNQKNGQISDPSTSLKEENVQLKTQLDDLLAKFKQLKKEKKEKVQLLKAQIAQEEKLANRLYLDNRDFEKKIYELTKERDHLTKQLAYQQGTCSDSSLTDYLNQQLLKSYFQYLSAHYETATSPEIALTFPNDLFTPLNNDTRRDVQNQNKDLSEDWV